MTVPPKAVGLLVGNIILQVFAIFGVLLRFAARLKKRQPLKSDDWTIFVSLIFCIGLCSSFIYGVCTGLYGVSWSQITPDDFVRFRKIQFAAILICHFVYGLIKISVVLFYKRIFTIGRFTIAANITLGAITTFIIVSFFTMLFCARGVTSFWTTPAPLEGTQYVLYPPAFITAYAVVDVVLDLAVLSLPLPIIKRMQLSRKKKLGVAAIFLLGAFCLVCSIIRLYYTRSLEGFTGQSIDDKARLSEKNDFWAHIEAYASVFTACLPTLRPLFTTSRNLESIMISVRSLFSIHSKTQESLDRPQPQFADFNTTPHDWPSKSKAEYELKPDTNVTNVTIQHPEDLERQSQKSDTAMMPKSFTSRA